MAAQRLDPEQWPRRDVYRFFSGMQNPFYMVTFQLDVTELRAYTKQNGLSFYYALVWLCTEACNEVEAFRLTLRGGEVWRLDRRDPSFTDLPAGSEVFHIVTLPAGDDLALDYFRTSMYGAFTYINVDGYAKGFERTPGELKMIERMGKLNPHINRAQEVVGYPFIRETPFGTVWVSDRGGALFFYDAVKELKVELPSGWGIEGVKGNVLHDVKPDTIHYLRKTN